MDREKIEDKLYKHYGHIRRLNYLKAKLPEVERKIVVIEDKINRCDYRLSDTLSGISYEGVSVQTSNISKPTEDELISAHDKIQIALESLQSDRREINEELGLLTGEIKIIADVIEDIPEPHAGTVLKAIYGYGKGREKSLREIGEDLGYSHGAIANIRDRCLGWIRPVIQTVDKQLTNGIQKPA